MMKFTPLHWTPCKCPSCGHEQEAESQHLAERGAKCEKCGRPTKERPNAAP